MKIGDKLWIRRKGDEHVHQNLLIISLEYNENDLISMNDKPMREWLDNTAYIHTAGTIKECDDVGILFESSMKDTFYIPYTSIVEIEKTGKDEL